MLYKVQNFIYKFLCWIVTLDRVICCSIFIFLLPICKPTLYLFFFLQSYSLNITTVKGFETFLGSLKARSSDGRNTGVDLVLSCVDNYEARMVVNQV